MSEQPPQSQNRRWDCQTTDLVFFLYRSDIVAREHKSDEVSRVLQNAGFVAQDGLPLEVNLSATASGAPPVPSEGRMLEMNGGEAHVQWCLRANLPLAELRLSLRAEMLDSSSLLGESLFTAEMRDRLVKVFTQLCGLPGFEAGGGLEASRYADIEEIYEECALQVMSADGLSLDGLLSSPARMWTPLFLGRRHVQRLGRERLLRCPGWRVFLASEDVVCIYVIPYGPTTILPDPMVPGIGPRVREYLQKLLTESGAERGSE